MVDIGDTIKTETYLGVHEYVITRVTKTLAMSLRESDGYEYKFRRVISDNMRHPYFAHDNTSYEVIKAAKHTTNQ